MQRNNSGSLQQDEYVKNADAKGMSYNEILSKLLSLQNTKFEPIFASHTHEFIEEPSRQLIGTIKVTPGIATGKRPLQLDANIYLDGVENCDLTKPRRR